jgi:prevent-host-death family protein
MDPQAPRVGIRELRNQVAAVVRRAAAGERVVVTVDGRAVAQLGPLEPAASGPSLDDLAAMGLLEPPARKASPPGPPAAGDLPVDVRLDRLFDQLRGR